MKKKKVLIIALAALVASSVGGSVVFAQYYNNEGNSSTAIESSTAGTVEYPEENEQLSSEEQAYLAEFRKTGSEADKIVEYRSEAISLSKKAGYLDDSYDIEKFTDICKKSWLTNEDDAGYKDSLKGFCEFITALCSTYADKDTDLSVRDRMLLYYEIDELYLQLSMRVKDDTIKEFAETKVVVEKIIK